MVDGSYGEKSKTTYECDNCGWKTKDEEMFTPLGHVDHLLERIEGGCTVPAGECPVCGALVYPVKKMLVLTGPGGEVHGAVEVSGISEHELDKVIGEASDRLSAIQIERHVVGIDGLRGWLKQKDARE